MRIPHIINKDTLAAYVPSPESLALKGENDRIIKSEDFTEWDKDIVPKLNELCVSALNKTFEKKPILDSLMCDDRNYLLEILSVNLPLEFAIQKIDNEGYWEKRYLAKFGVCTRLKPRKWTWKSLYMERHVQFMIENAEPQHNDEEFMDEMLGFCNPYVTKIKVTQLLPWIPPIGMEEDDIPEVLPKNHINLMFIFKKLSNLEEFDIIYGKNNVGEDFSWRLLDVSVLDCRNLGKAVEAHKFIKILRLHRSFIDDEHAQALARGLVKNNTLEELDLSNCRIKDDGALCIAKVLLLHSKLKKLNLCNNLIKKKGAEGIGYALIRSTSAPLRKLNLRLNPLMHEGCLAIFRAMMRSNRPANLNLAACGFEEETGARLAQVIEMNKCLVNLDVSCNWIGEDNGQKVMEGLMRNRTINWLNMRETSILPDHQATIKRLLIRNRTGDEGFSDSEVEINEEESSEEEDEGAEDTDSHVDSEAQSTVKFK